MIYVAKWADDLAKSSDDIAKWAENSVKVFL